MPRNGYHQVKHEPRPKPEDAIPPGMCKTCGMLGAGNHKTLEECIDALRDRLAMQPEESGNRHV